MDIFVYYFPAAKLITLIISGVANLLLNCYSFIKDGSWRTKWGNPAFREQKAGGGMAE